MASVVPTPAINAQVRDIVFKFEDSCNCCVWCCPQQMKPTDHVFINSNYNVEKFDPKKATQGLEDSLSRKRIKEKAEQIIGATNAPLKNSLNDKIKQNTVLLNDPVPNKPLTYDEVHVVNQIFISTFLNS